MKSVKPDSSTPREATHFNLPFWFKVNGSRCKVWCPANQEWDVSSAWSVRELLQDRDTRRVRWPTATGYMEYPEFRKGD